MCMCVCVCVYVCVRVCVWARATTHATVIDTQVVQTILLFYNCLEQLLDKNTQRVREREGGGRLATHS